MANELFICILNIRERIACKEGENARILFAKQRDVCVVVRLQIESTGRKH